MERWRTILRRFRPRQDVEQPFYPDREEVEGPVLLNSMGPMAAAFVAARLLRGVVVRGGSVVRASAVEKLERLLRKGLGEEVVHHCEEEAEKILEWLGRGPSDDDLPLETTPPDPDLDVMVQADLESRLSVATFALEEGYDLELEYFDDTTATWPRTRARLEGIENAEAADFETSLQLRDATGWFDVPVKQVRWLMPIPPLDDDELDDDDGAEVVEFPGD